jgi:molybdopterin molybdotransferase
LIANVQPDVIPGFDQALDTVLKYCRQIAPPPPEVVELVETVGRVLAQSILADRDFPPFARATRDGYAVRAEDLHTLPACLRVVGQIKAGAAFARAIAPGEAAEIMTGAAVPEGANAVVMIEHTATAVDATQQVAIQRAVGPGENVVAPGAEARAGQEIVPPGMRLGAAQIAMAAGAGQAKVHVYRRPRVAILATGDELVDVSKTPGPFQIRNSNTFSLAAQVAAWGGEAIRLPIAPDEPRKLATLMQAGLSADMLLISGGVSMGKFDLVEEALKAAGAEFFFTGALIQPGRPVVFGELRLLRFGSHRKRTAEPDSTMLGGQTQIVAGAEDYERRVPFFGLPGNPVSAMVCFDLFARPVLEALGGARPTRLPVAKARLRHSVKTKTGLTRFLPAIISAAAGGGVFDPEVETVAWQGSGDLLASARANCYLVVPPDRDSLAAGEMVAVLTR